MPPDIAEARRTLSANIKRHCATLGLEAECPYYVVHPLGSVVEFAAYLPQFGGPKGMLVDVIEPDPTSGDIVPKSQDEAARASGLYHSFVDAEAYGNIEVLLEAWGYFGAQADLSKSLQETFFIFRSDG